MDARTTLDRIAAEFHQHPGVQQKAGLSLVSEILGRSDWVQGYGDDAAAVPTAEGYLLAAGEALWPPFVAQDPRGAGVGAVIANVNDIAAMGGRCVGLVDTLIAAEPDARAALEGMRWAAERYGVPVLGGHLTLHEGPASLSAFAVGQATTLLSARHAASGHVLLHAVALEGRLRSDFPFFPAVEERGGQLPGDVALLAEVAERGLAVAAKDISMAGMLGSLAMLLEPSGCGVVVDGEQVPRPDEVGLDRWLRVFPSYGFLLCVPPAHVDACAAAFTDRGLACAPIGHLDGSGQLRVRLDGCEALIADLTHDSVTRLASPTDDRADSRR